ncbi:unnamed protein product [Parnassius apollo]|uniref:(apollo) hypothetical protein n=1 Tax=Parnassius apollo TaxID=110799 RepID=A0A8S3WBP1_PARAO|nr:unnamed protein product [Parnassius apollo]
MSILYQIGCSVIVCYTSFTLGLMYVWPSTTVKIFSSSNTTLHRPMYETEIALFGSLSSIGALVSTLLSAFLLDNIGRKYSCVLSSLAQVMSWTIVIVSNRVEAILVATFISGIGGNCLLIVPIFVSEFCQDSIRGTTTSGSMIAFNLGMLISYLLGGCLKYNTMMYTCFLLSIASVVMLLLLKESPLFLMKKGLEKDAANVIAFYNREKVDSIEVLEKINKIKMALNPDFKSMTLNEEKLNRNSQSLNKNCKWAFFKKSRSTRRALLVVLIIYTAVIFQGTVVVQVYAKPLFEEAIPNISATLSSVLLAIISVLSNCVGAYLVDVVGRRALIIYSSVGAGVSCVILGSQISLNWGPRWINGVFIYLFSITHMAGSEMVPIVLVSEVFLPDIKSLMSMICLEWAWICNFTVLFIFNPLVSAIGLGPVFYIFAGICFGGAVFCFFFLPETKGLSVDLIETLFAKNVYDSSSTEKVN